MIWRKRRGSDNRLLFDPELSWLDKESEDQEEEQPKLDIVGGEKNKTKEKASELSLNDKIFDIHWKLLSKLIIDW